ncbi:MAG: hypothetical protein AAFZ52_01365 [Bacteroidota bacterium]
MTLIRISCWLLVAGCWLLVAGCWLLVAGCWLLKTSNGSTNDQTSNQHPATGAKRPKSKKPGAQLPRASKVIPMIL